MADNKTMWKGVDVEEYRYFTKNFEDVGSFTIRIPSGLEKTRIIAATRKSLDGYYKDESDSVDDEYVRMLVALNMIITEHPAWWTAPENCPDEEFLWKLWRWSLDCEKEFATKLKTVTKGKAVGKD